MSQRFGPRLSVRAGLIGLVRYLTRVASLTAKSSGLRNCCGVRAAVHCGLCAERCPTYAWDMRKFVVQIPYANKSVIPLMAV